MTENYKILSEFIKDMASETPDIETYLFVKENISNDNFKFRDIRKKNKGREAANACIKLL